MEEQKGYHVLNFIFFSGYYGDGLNAIIIFSGCYLPDRSRRDYQYVMDNLFM